LCSPYFLKSNASAIAPNNNTGGVGVGVDRYGDDGVGVDKVTVEDTSRVGTTVGVAIFAASERIGKT
jgi:hypothetical protein